MPVSPWGKVRKRDNCGSACKQDTVRARLPLSCLCLVGRHSQDTRLVHCARRGRRRFHAEKERQVVPAARAVDLARDRLISRLGTSSPSLFDFGLCLNSAP